MDTDCKGKISLFFAITKKILDARCGGMSGNHFSRYALEVQ